MKKILLATVIVNLLVTTAAIAFATSVIYSGFPDVKEDTYYYDAVKNVSLAGYINGYSNGNFGPNDYLTRGQAAVILDNYNKKNYPHIESKVTETDLQKLYGLKYVCPEKELTCLYVEDVADDWGCDNEDYVKWVEDNCDF
jgi:hypothetical protein